MRRIEPATGILHWCDRFEGPFIPSRQQMLAEALARCVPVVTTRFVSSSGRPGVTRCFDDRDGLTTIDIDFGSAERLRPARLRKYLTPLVARQVKAIARSVGIDRYILYRVGDGPYSPWGLSPTASVVDLIDPPFVENSAEIYQRSLPQMLTGADLVTVTSRTLADEVRSAGYEVFEVPNACRGTVETSEHRSATRRVGYLGSIDWRFDTFLMERVASAMPDIEFVFAGRRLDGLTKELDRLAQLPNVLMPGIIDFDDTTQLLASFDVGVIPFRRGFTGDAINPVKMYEYLAHGLPVVATPIRECLAHVPLIACPSSPEDWVAALRAALRDRGAASMEQRRAFAAQNTWDHRAQRIVEALVDAGMLATAESAPSRVASREI